MRFSRLLYLLLPLLLWATAVDATDFRSTNNASSASANSITIPAAAGCTTTDLAVVSVHANGVTTIADANGGTPFTEDVNDYQETSAGLTTSIFHRVLQGGDPSSYTFNIGATGRVTGVVLCYSTPHATQLFDVAPTNGGCSQVSTGLNITASSITTAHNDSIDVIFYGADGSTNAFTVLPAGYNNRAHTGDQRILAVDLDDPTAGATGTQQATYTISNGAFACPFAIMDHTATLATATLSSPTPSGTLGTSTTATLGATTDQVSGTFYSVVESTGALLVGITAAQIIAGNNNLGSAADAACNAPVGSSTPSCGATGLVASTAYSYASVQNNGSGASNIVTGTFTTGAGSSAVPTISVVILH